MGKVTFKTVARVGSVVVKQSVQSGRYFVAWWLPSRKKMHIEACRDSRKSEAVRQAREINEALARNPAARFARQDPATVALAVAETITGARTTNPRTLRVLEDHGRYLIRFMQRRYPSLKLWHQVRNEHLEAWAAELVAKGLSTKTVGNYCRFAVQVSRYMAERYPAEGIYFALQAPAAAIARAGAVAAVDYLDLDELLAVYRAAEAAGDLRAAAVVLLSGMCGLRLSEMAQLRADGFDLGNGTLEVPRSKTEAGLRTIPLPRQVAAALQPLIDATPGPWLLMSERGQALADYRIGYLVRPWLRRVACDTGNTHLEGVAPKHLRKSAFNLLKAAGVDPEYRRAYCGHAETTVAGRHYEDRNSRRAVERLRKEVVDPLEAYLGQGWGAGKNQASGRITRSAES